MGRVNSKIDYETLRDARILENRARLASLGLQKTLSDLRYISSSAKSERTQKRKYTKCVIATTPLRRSDRLKRVYIESKQQKVLSLRRSIRFGKEGKVYADYDSEGDDSEEEERRPANAPSVKEKIVRFELSPEASARRCDNKRRGSVYDPVLGICCHFCRQKKLCGEDECKRCGDRDPDQPCIGKTDCSVCHSTNGVFCRGCLMIRYGEDLDEVRANNEWMCPHCIEERGVNPHWICNSSFCLKKRKMAPTGIAIYQGSFLVLFSGNTLVHFLLLHQFVDIVVLVLFCADSESSREGVQVSGASDNGRASTKKRALEI